MKSVQTFVLIFSLIEACASAPSPAAVQTAADYGARLEECNRTSKTCDESIACENKVRTEMHRPLRDPKAGCL